MKHVNLKADEPPKNGHWVDACSIIAHPTPQEVREGNRLGREIDTTDNADSGLVRIVSERALSQYDSARQKAEDLKRIMLEFGVPEVSIELCEGRPNTFGTWDALFVVADMSHHTVSRYAQNSLTPCLSLVKVGRSDLPGPLCNGYGGFDLCYRIISFGYANHPGEGGPYTVPALTAGTFTIPKDSGRRYMWGTEWEGGLNEFDWDRVLTNPRNGVKMTMREFMGRSNAALEKYHEIHERAHLEHSTWTPRKIDRLNYTAQKGIEEKAPFREGGDWFDMATQADLEAALKNVLQENLGGADIIVEVTPAGQDNVKWNLNRVFRELLNDEARLATALSAQVDQIASAVVAKLPEPAPTDSLTKQDVEDAVKLGLREVLGALDN